MALLKPITKAQYYVFTSGLEMYFNSFSGINDTAQSGSYANGTGNRIYKVTGPRELDDITLTTPYDPEQSQELEQFWLEYQCEYLTISVQPVSCGDNPENLGDPYILEGCLLTGIKLAEVDRESGDVATMELTFTANSWRRG